jgi:hypothetical protein
MAGTEGVAHASPVMTLALAPSSGRAETEVCSSLLEGSDDDRSVLYVALTGAAVRRVERTPGAAGDGAVTVVRVGDSAGRGPATGPDGVEMRTVSDPSNLTRLGIEFTDWLAGADGTDRVVCLHSLDAFLQYVAADRLFRFLSVMSDHLREAGARAHVHADPAACEESTLATLRQVFDEVVEEESATG